MLIKSTKRNYMSKNIQGINLISVVSPIYNASLTVEALCDEIFKALSVYDAQVEIILSDDGSPDNSWEIIENLSNKDPRIKGIKLSRNFGQHYAITAGIDNAAGDLVAVIDCDLEDHPKYLYDLIEKMMSGKHDIVFAKRMHKKHKFIKRLLSRLYVFTINSLAGINHDSSVGTFSILNKKAVDALKQYRESLRAYTLLVYEIGFDVGYCPIKHSERYAGTSNYSLPKLLKLTLHTTLVSTDKPLYIISVLGFLISIGSFLFILILVFSYLYNEAPVSGWSSTIASIYLLGGIIIFSIGVNGIYLGKCFRETLKRPLYHISKRT